MADTYRADTILAVDIGSATTRASLFDVVEGVHRLVASAEEPSTAEPPYRDASEGMQHALRQLEALTGRILLDGNAQVIVPAKEGSAGVDIFATTISAGPALRTFIVGLLPEISLENARQIAASAYCSILESSALNDRRRDDEVVDAFLAANPDLVVISGGTDGGAKDALLRKVDLVNIACNLMPPGHKPYVLYVGNAALKDQVTRRLGDAALLHTAPNVQPDLGDAGRQLAPARAELAGIFNELRQAQIGGLARMAQASGGFPLVPTAYAEGQLLQHLGQMLGRNVLSVNVGSAATSLIAVGRGAAAPCINVRPDLGIGVNAPRVLAETSAASLVRWLPDEPPDGDNAVRDFVFNKAAHPRTVPADLADLYLELALVKEAVRANFRQARRTWPAAVLTSEGLPAFDVMIGGGAALGQAPHPGLAALTLLDAIEPGGYVQSLLIDEHHLLAALGSVAAANPLAVTQILEGELLLNLGVAVCASGTARLGDKICQARLASAGSAEQTVDLKFGEVEILPLPLGQRGKLTLRPRGGIDVGFGPGRGATRDVSGGAVGVILDGRGRPIAFPADAVKRREIVQRWITRVSTG
jgi:uncharacterized protein (TIGR01319 family)